MQFNNDGSVTISLDSMDRACGRCMKTVPTEELTTVYSAFDDPIPVPEELKDICEPITGVWIETCKSCLLPDDEVKS